MDHTQIDDSTLKGIAAAEEGDFSTAMIFLGRAAKFRNTPELHSYLAYCLAKEEGRIHSAAKVCRESIKRQPENSLHYLLLGRILLMAEEKTRAIKTFRSGLRASPNPKIISELKRLGLRKPAVLKNLNRSHPLNLVLGRIFSGIGIR